MKSEAFTHYSDAGLTALGLCLFLAVFVGAIIWTGLRANRAKYQHLSNVPLHDEDRALPGGQG